VTCTKDASKPAKDSNQLFNRAKGAESREQGAGNRVQEAGRKRSEQDDDKGHCSCRSRWAAGCAARARETATGALPANAGRRKFLAHQNRTAATTTT